MSSTEMQVDADFLSHLVAGSMEAQAGAVDQAISDNESLFGGDTETQVRAVATFTEHVIVANSRGEFYRAAWKPNEEGSIQFEEVSEIDVPIIESHTLTLAGREKAREVVEAMLEGAHDLDDRLRDLADLAVSGPRLTAEGVEDHWSGKDFAESDWFQATRQEESKMRAFVGAEMNRLDVPKPKFETMIETDLTEAQEEGHRTGILSGLKRLSESLDGYASRLQLATQIDESYTARGGDAMAASDFVEFVEGYTADLDDLAGVVADAAAVSEDGCVKCLARLHDGVAGQMFEWALAAAFIEKLARRFEAPSAA